MQVRLGLRAFTRECGSLHAHAGLGVVAGRQAVQYVAYCVVLPVARRRWGYKSLGEVKAVVEGYREADIPLEAMWTGAAPLISMDTLAAQQPLARPPPAS